MSELRVFCVGVGAVPDWETKLGGITLNGNSMTSVTKAVLDTGTSLLAGPSTEVAALAAAVGATPFLNGEYTIDCGSIRCVLAPAVCIDRSSRWRQVFSLFRARDWNI